MSNGSIWHIDGTLKLVPLWIDVDLDVLAVKGYSTFPWTPGLEPHHEIGYCYIQDIGW